MEDSTANAEAHSQEAVEEKTPTLEELQEALTKQQALIDQLSSSKERILAESKDYKSKYSELRTTVEAAEKAKLEESENWKELLEREKNEKFELQEKWKNLRQQTVKANLQFKAAQLAADAWNIDDVINSMPSDAIEIGEDLSVAGIENAINAVREAKPYLFKQEQAASMVSSNPGGKPKAPDWKSLSVDEKAALFMEAELKSKPN